jgi:uncharacterized protein YecE (DUF72 family)
LDPNPRFLSPDLFRDFLSRLEPLHDLLGPVMFQFEYLNRQKMKSQREFLRLLDEFIRIIPVGFQYGIEIRNQNYLNAAWFEFLGNHSLVPVLIQGYWMPPVVEVYRKHRGHVLGSQAVVLRLHGPGRQDMEKLTGKKWDQIVAPKDAELDGITGMVRDLRDNGVHVYVNVNNHYEGSAPLTIRRIQERL